tara:strand:- start:866 stop:1417 length:552 start_codon:yes stop_codon:yes gene_type:complete
MKAKEFSVEFQRLVAAKQHNVDLLMTDVYYEELGGLPYIEETLRKARNLIWYRDYEKTISRFPETTEIKAVHKEIAEEKKRQIQNEKLKQLYQAEAESPSKYFKNKPAYYGNALFAFCWKCNEYFNYKSDSVWDYLEKNNIEIKIGFPTKRDDFIKYATKKLGKNKDKIAKASFNNKIFSKIA